MKTGLLILGNQLFDPQLIQKYASPGAAVFMREDVEFCTYYKFHKHKLILFLSAMRKFADELRNIGYSVHYENLGDFAEAYEIRLQNWIVSNRIQQLVIFEIEDKFFERRIAELIRVNELDCQVVRSPMFVTTRSDFKQRLSSNNKIVMQSFYEWQRKRFKLLIDSEALPLGGAWSFDQQNRKALPRSVNPPPPFLDAAHCPVTIEVKNLVTQHFADHPGICENFWLPVDRAGARRWLAKFLEERLTQFGPYEDAITPNSDFVFHSILSPYLNMGLLTPREVISAALAKAREKNIPINSLEGFIRQVIGWREFVRGIYQNFSERQDRLNFWDHQRRLKPCWYTGTTGIPPLDNCIKKLITYGYAHHIERLMVAGSLMLLLEVAPPAAHRWFMEMFIDSSDWVMGPNVYGMALFSDGGIFATKPYICGSSYYRKMGGYRYAEWCDGVDGLYWQFVERHAKYFLQNPRLAHSAKAALAMEPGKKLRLSRAAEKLKEALVE